jgi:hypothetical protein
VDRPVADAHVEKWSPGVVAGRAAASLLRWLWRPLRLTAAVAAAAIAVVAVFQTWNTRPSEEPLLVPMFLLIVGPAVVWAVFAAPPARTGAQLTAAVIALSIAHAAAL